MALGPCVVVALLNGGPGVKPKSWERIWTIFEEVVAQPSSAQRSFLDAACNDDTEVRSAVEEMLEADAGDQAFFDQPILGPAMAAARDHIAEARAGGSSWGPTTLERIGPYRILRPVGQGGMGMVFLAVRDDDAFDRRVVVKLVRHGMGDEATLMRLRVERQILASLDHPNIARLYDGGSTKSGAPYFVMEYVEGVAVDVFCEQNALSVDERIALFLRVCDAVRYAHQNLVVHRDLKPANILVTANGEPKLLDFGIAKLLNPELTSARIEPTATWQRALTPSYASPEQIRGRLVTTASDVYSLGVLLYKLLAGRVPYHFGGRSPAEIERLVTEHPPPPPSKALVSSPTKERTTTLSSAVSGAGDEINLAATEPKEEERRLQRQLVGDLDAIVLKALRAAPQQRYGSVEQLTEDLLRRQRGLPVLARQGNWRYRFSKLVRRHRTAVAAMAVSLSLLTAFGVTLAGQSARVRSERDLARVERDRSRQMASLVDAMVSYAEPYEAVGGDLTVREAIVRSVPVVAPRLSTERDLRGRVLQATGAMLGRLGAQSEARGQLEEALEIRRSLHGESHPDVIETMSSLASVLKIDGEHAAAEDLARRALAQARVVFPEGAPALVAPLNAMASVLCFQDRFAEAEVLAEEAMSLATRLGPGEIDRQIYTLEMMAVVRKGMGAYPESEALYRDALERRRVAFGENHPGQQASLHNLGFVLHRQGRLAEAERVYRQALGLLASTYGEQHHEYATTLNNLAGVRFARGDYEGAVSDFEATLATLEATLAPDHPRLFFVEQWIEASRLRRGEAGEAERNLRAGIGRWTPVVGAEHWLFARAQSILGEAVAAQGRHQEAVPLLESSYRSLAADGSKREAEKGLDRLVSVLEHLDRVDEIEGYRALMTSG